ncbi:hypothetical protein FB451DRAFT_1405798 [Mycena latifolia]|nr:hypothetical protein FB451DRAFT_1405798 [Mycena latifolia]
MSVFSSNQPAPSSSPPIVLFSVLGVAGPLQNENAGRMILDWMIFTTLLASLAGFDGPRFRYRSIRDVIPLFPDQTFLFGEAGSDRLRFRVPSCLFDEHAQKNEVFDAEDFVCSCFLDIAASASRVQSGEKFILLLIGHGERTRTGEFRLCVTTESNRLGEAWLSKRQLELAVAECRGQITVICNSCHSGALESPRWQFVCAAGPNELAEALTTSASGNVRGSAFSLCALAEVGQEQGLVMPFSRSETRPVGTADEDIYHLTGGSSSMVTLVRISNRVDSARHRLHLLAPPFSPIPKSLRRDKQDADLCRRFLHDSKSLAEGEILDFASSLLTRHIQSVVIQLISMELGWSPSSNVTPFLSLEDANSGEFFIDEMIENGIPLDDLALCLLAHFEGYVEEQQ